MYGLFAVIVTYHHDDDMLGKLLISLDKASYNVIIIKNSDEKIESNSVYCTQIQNSKNVGLAKALNQGIEKAMEFNPKLILLFDQDSFIKPDQLHILADEAIKIFRKSKVAAVGPSFSENNVNITHGFAHYSGLIVSAKRLNVKSCDSLYLITSGTVLNPLYLGEIGLMNENLFIDYIDIEWGMRARSLGYRLVGLNEVHMEHLVGDAMFSFLWYKVPLHSTTRLYYQTRNSIFLYKMKHLPLRWKIADFIYFIKRSILYLIVNIKNINVISKAILDGVRMNG